MKVLFLGQVNNPVIEFLKLKDNVIVYDSPIDLEFILKNRIEFIVSYGYRHIIKPDVLKYMQGNAINLHISYLPFNRGADPNFWSFFEGTPKGVTIHLLDKGIDTGDIIVQKLLSLDESYNLMTTYQILQNEIQNLFYLNWDKIRTGNFQVKKQPHKGSYHNSNDKFKYIDPDKYLNIPVRDLCKIFE